MIFPEYYDVVELFLAKKKLPTMAILVCEVFICDL